MMRFLSSIFIFNPNHRTSRQLFCRTGSRQCPEPRNRVSAHTGIDPSCLFYRSTRSVRTAHTWKTSQTGLRFALTCLAPLTIQISACHPEREPNRGSGVTQARQPLRRNPAPPAQAAGPSQFHRVGPLCRLTLRSQVGRCPPLLCPAEKHGGFSVCEIS